MLDLSCHIVTHRPAGRSGPFNLRTAVRRVVEHRPPADRVELVLDAGTVVSEEEIQALYALARLSVMGRAVHAF